MSNQFKKKKHFDVTFTNRDGIRYGWEWDVKSPIDLGHSFKRVDSKGFELLPEEIEAQKIKSTFTALYPNQKIDSIEQVSENTWSLIYRGKVRRYFHSFTLKLW